MKNLDLKRMLEDINELVGTDFCESMCAEPYAFTQEEAKKMAEIIGKVYSIAHCTHCKSCQTKYLIKNNDSN